MSIISYFKESFRRKKARRITMEYPAKLDTFQLKDEGKIEFYNWDNPLVSPVAITQEKVDFYKQFIKKGDMVIDIGANTGDTTVPMALAAGANGITLGFDPNPYVFKLLEKNAALNPNKQNIVTLPYAITVKEEEYFYISSEASFSNGGISPTSDSAHGKFIYPEKIKGVNLLDFLQINYPGNLEKLSFIKIDTEGYDKEIIKSITDLILKYKPTLIAESFAHSNPAERIELFDLVKGLGYDLYYFEDFLSTAKVIEIVSSEQLINWGRKSIDFYAVPKKNVG